MGQVTCFGEMLLRLSPSGGGMLFQTHGLDAHFGGAEANVAIGLARLGTSTAMVSAVPDDAIGDGAIEALRRYGVDTRYVRRAPGRLGLYFLSPGAGLRAAAVIYDRGGSTFAGTVPGAFDWASALAGSDWLHLSGITPALGPGATALALEAVRAADTAGVRVAFDGNYRATLWDAWDGRPRETLRALVGGAELLFGNHRDIALLLDSPFAGTDDATRRAAAEAAFAAFPRLQWIASTARHVEDAGTNRISCRLDARAQAWTTDEVAVGGIVDRIGTGDAFAAGVLHGLIAGDPERAVEIGHALAVLKHYTPGDASLSGPAEVAAFLAGTRDVRR